MALELAELLREHWPSYARAHRAQLCAAHYRAVRSVLACRTPELGGRLYRCGGCHQSHYAYHSCNHRNCPRCGARAQQLWSAKQEARLLPGVPYFMVTFTLPAELRGLCRSHPEVLYDLLLRESAATFQDVLATKTGGGRGGCTGVFHSWGRQMQHHPHVHLIVPALAYHPESGRLIHPKKDTFLVHFRPLARRFRTRLGRALRQDHPELFATLGKDERAVFTSAKEWNVQLQHVGSGHTALRYLARYVRRSAFSAQRLLGYDAKGRVRLRWTDSTTGQTSILHLTPHEFIRRWLLHVLPKGFTRLRHYGFLSSAARKTRLRIRLLLGAGLEPTPTLPEPEAFCCQHCGSPLSFLREIAPIHPLRGPPRKSMHPNTA